MLPKLSIIMPVINREDTIEKAICSVLNQNYPHLEFIILDGGSRDGTVGIIKKYADRIAYWHSQPDGSAAAGTNMGLQKATGDVIGLLMADDWYEPGIFQAIANAYETHPNADMFTCAGQIVQFNESQQCFRPLAIYDTERRMRLTISNICFDITSAICCRFIKRSLYEKIGFFIPFDEDGKQFLTNDKEFLLRAVMNNAKDVFIPQLGHTYLAHQASYSFGNNRQSAIKHCHEHMTIAKNYLKKYDLPFSERWLFRYWYNDQSARLLLYKLLEGNLSEALKTAKDGLKQYTVFWPIAFAITLGRITYKRSQRALQKR